MDNNKKEKLKEFFRKEGFYIVLFLCLCVVAAVTVVTTNDNNEPEQATEEQNEFTYNTDEEEVSSDTQMQNADRVENDTDEMVENTEEVVENSSEVVDETSKDLNVSAGTTTEVKLSNPVEGSIARGYTFPKPQEMKDGTHRNIRGIDIKAGVGTEVKAAAVGEVKEVSSKAEEGNYVVIAHANGVNTKYSNLGNDVKVKVGDKVTEESVIGAVGDSSKIFTNKEFGEHLNIQVQDSNGKDLDPTKYFSYKSE